MLVEDGDETLGDDVVEAFQEAVQLLADGARHLHLADQVHVLQRVLCRHSDVAAVGLQVADFGDAKLLDLSDVK